jgi:hypothetical protein
MLDLTDLRRMVTMRVRPIVSFMLLVVCTAPAPLEAAQKAITDTGREVILQEDGTWRYATPPQGPGKIDFSSQEFMRPENASFKLKSKNTDAVFWLDPTKWTFRNGTADTEYEFDLKYGDVYANAITEGIEIELDNLMEIALENARQAAPDLNVRKREYRVVNGEKVGFLEFAVSTQGANLIFMGCFHSDQSGSTQLLAWTAANLLDKHKGHIQELLNGLAVD